MCVCAHERFGWVHFAGLITGYYYDTYHLDNADLTREDKRGSCISLAAYLVVDVLLPTCCFPGGFSAQWGSPLCTVARHVTICVALVSAARLDEP